MKKIIQRGAEAVIRLEEVEGEKVIVKERIRKGYRVPELDQRIRSRRTRGESKLMERARNLGVPVPGSRISGEFSIVMDYVKGERLKDLLNGMEPGERERVCEEIGTIIGVLHASGIVHGDITTSNMIMDKKGKLFLIDFGLGKFSNKVEDHAVDLFLLFEALKAAHFRVMETCWRKILKAYGKEYSDARAVLSRVEKIKRRRRYLGE